MSKKVLTKSEKARIVATVPRLSRTARPDWERVPCKLNNEEMTSTRKRHLRECRKRAFEAGLSQLPVSGAAMRMAKNEAMTNSSISDFRGNSL